MIKQAVYRISYRIPGRQQFRLDCSMRINIVIVALRRDGDICAISALGKPRDSEDHMGRENAHLGEANNLLRSVCSLICSRVLDFNCT